MTSVEQESTAPPTRRSIADDLVAACAAAGTTHVFGVPGGGSNLDVVAAAGDHGLSFVLAHGENAAAVMAAVTGELTAAPGLCVATRGPGAASAVNGVAQALLDRQPMVLVTDCVSALDQPRISHQRLDQQELMGSVCLASIVLDGRDPRAARTAVALTRHPRPGPVHVDLDPTSPRAVLSPDGETEPPLAVDAQAQQRVAELVAAAQRLVVVVGVGAPAQPPASRADIVAALDELGRRTQTPVLCTYKARGFVSDEAPWCAGVATGATIEAPLLQDADLIVGIGLDPVELIPSPWPYPAPVLLLGAWALDDSAFFADPAGRRRVVEVVADLASLTRVVARSATCAWPAGIGQQHRKAAYAAVLSAVPDGATDGAADGLTPQQVVTVARDAAPPTAIATVDAGAHMLVAMPLWEVTAPGRLLVSSGLATMGFALPAAIAAALVRAGDPVVCFTGDGGLGMVLAELETLARLDLPVVVVVFNDATLSLIAAKQAPAGHGGPDAVTYSPTDFAAIGRACGLRAEHVDDVEGYRAALRTALACGRPTLLDVRVDPSAYGEVLRVIRG